KRLQDDAPLPSSDAQRLVDHLRAAVRRLPRPECTALRETRVLQATICALADVYPLNGARLRGENEPPAALVSAHDAASPPAPPPRPPRPPAPGAPRFPPHDGLDRLHRRLLAPPPRPGHAAPEPRRDRGGRGGGVEARSSARADRGPFDGRDGALNDSPRRRR